MCSDRESQAKASRQEAGGSSARPWFWYLSLALLCLLVALYWLWPPYQQFLETAWQLLRSGDQQRTQDWVASYGAWGPVIIVLLMVVQMFLVVVPSWLLMVIAVLAWGPLKGCLIAIAAVIVASTVGYFVGQMAGRPLLRKLLNEDAEQKVRRETERYGLWAVVIARLNPLLSNDAISIIGGMLRLGFWRFMLATIAGIAPLAMTIAVMGSDWEQMQSGLLWLSILSLLGLGIKVWFDKRRDRQQRTQENHSGRGAANSHSD